MSNTSKDMTTSTTTTRGITRRGFAAATAATAATAVLAGAGTLAYAAEKASSTGSVADASTQANQGAQAASTQNAAEIPAPNPDPNDIFHLDLGVNMTTIDQYLGRDDVAYRDVRMVFDPADWGSMDADPDLMHTIEGFEVVPYPYLATLEALPVDNAYTGDTLFTLTWDNDTDYNIVEATPNYRESQTILEELFPKDKVIFLMCGGAGYAYMTKKLLVFLSWDEDKVYNVGGNWYYQGDHAVQTIERGQAEDGSEDTFALWRVNIPTIDFTLLHPVEG